MPPSLNVDFLVIVMCHKRRPSSQAVPNAMAVWLDPAWSGFWVQEYAAQSVDHSFENCAFRVSGSFNSIKELWISSDHHHHATPKEAICNSVKIHFFQVRPQNEETCRDFLYSTSFPITEIIIRSKQPTSMYGVFNYNEKIGISSQRVRNVQVCVRNLNPSITSQLPAILDLPGPDIEHHKRTVQVGDWMDIAFNDMWPELHTTMSNPRTYFRDFCSTFFFTDICKLFNKEGKSQLPPWLACYCLCNALILNNVTPNDFAGEEYISAVSCSIPDPDKLQLIMRIIKDVLTPWTMCIHEGLYWSDKSLNKNVEDQPFPLSFMPTERVFGKDDCEGRASQAQEMVELLINIYLHTQSFGIDVTFAKLSRSKQCQAKLQVDHTTLVSLLQGCRKIGQLLYSKVLTSETIVGEADARALTNNNDSSSSPPELVGHSFGMMLYNDGYTKEYMMVENTCWQRRHLSGEPTYVSSDMIKILRGLKNVCVASKVVKAKENKIYQKLYMGHDKFFFSRRKRGGPLKYGISLRDIDQYGVCDAKEEGMVVSMSMEKVLEELSAKYQSDPPIWPAREGAEEILAQYKRIQQDIPILRRVLMTPTKTEDQFESLMTNWSPISQRHLPAQSGPCRGVWLTMDKPQYNILLKKAADSIRGHPYINSMVVCIISPCDT